MLTKEQKREQSEQLKDALSDVSMLFLLDNTGLNVNDVNRLRSEIRNTEATYKVVKNSVVKLAVDGTPMQDMTEFLVGPKALAFTPGDPVADHDQPPAPGIANSGREVNRGLKSAPLRPAVVESYCSLLHLV